MKTSTEILNTINTKIFGNIGLIETVLLESYTETENDIGEDVYEVGEQATYDGVVIDYTKGRPKYDKFGKYNGASFIVFLPSDAVFDEEYRICIRDKYYRIQAIEEKGIGGNALIYKVFVSDQADNGL